MAITTYAELQTAVADWLNRTDLTSVIPDFIRAAEASMNGRVRHYRGENRATLDVTTQYVALPSDFNSPIRMQIGATNYALEPMGPAELHDYRAKRNDTPGRPCFYALTGGEIELCPTPDDTYTLSMTYVTDIPPLSDANTTNWLLDEAPDAYLYGSLRHSAVYLQDDERIAVWTQLYGEALERLNTNSNRAKFGHNLRLRIK